MSNPSINFEITERDEAGAVTATYIHSTRKHGATEASKQTFARIDVIVCVFNFSTSLPVVV